MSHIVYIDRLSIYSLFALMKSGIDYSRIFYFEASSSEKLVNSLTKVGLLRAKPQFADYCLEEIRDERGECQFARIIEDITYICFEISDKEFTNHWFLKEFAHFFNSRKILIFFEKILSERMKDQVIFLNTAKWHGQNKVAPAGATITCFIENSLWSRYLLRYAMKLNIKAVEYRTLISGLFLTYFFPRIKKRLLTTIKSIFCYIITRRNKQYSYNLRENAEPTKKHKNIPMIAKQYGGKQTFVLDPKKRSVLFYFIKTKIPREHILVYSDGYIDGTKVPVTQDMVDEAMKQGIRFIALPNLAQKVSNSPAWYPGKRYKEMRNYFIRKICQILVFNAIKSKHAPLFYIVNVIYFIQQYSYWFDFFGSNDIKININCDDFAPSNIPMHLALESNDGISISYQWSNLSLSTVGLSSCADILFAFGPAYQWIWEANRSSISTLIYGGYITDHAFKETRDDALKLRGQLFNKGVTFIICFFDENSSDDKNTIISNSKAEVVYRYFILRMLEDKTLGLIFKPSYPATLYTRLPSLGNLKEKATNTGRCIFIDQGEFKTEKYPTEAAQTADLCVGLLLSGTVALEAYLSGTRTVFLDLEKLYSNPLYQWGKGKVVFDNFDDLFSAIDKFRRNPESIPGFGDLSVWVKDRDPFKDGNASLRIGQYVHWLLEVLKQGKSREEAIKYANRKYGEHWGMENVSRWH